MIGSPSLWELILVAVGAVAGYGFQLMLWPERVIGRKSNEELIAKVLNQPKPDLTHLTLHFSKATDTPKTKRPARPYFVENGRTRKAYHVRGEVKELGKRDLGMEFKSHNSEDEMLSKFKERGIEVITEYSKGQELD